MWHYAVIMLLAGVGIPILAALNAALGVHLGSPASAAVILFVVAFASAAVVAVIAGPASIADVRTAPKHLFLAGVLVAFYVLSITYVAPHFGVGNAVFFVLLGQLVSASLIDQFGLFSAKASPLTLTRALGLACIGLGLWLTQRS